MRYKSRTSGLQQQRRMEQVDITFPWGSLKDPRNQPVRHLVGVAFPVLAVLAAAAVLVAHAAVHQQDGHVNDVEVREKMAEAAGGAVGQRSHQVAGVVEVARHSPETRREELAAVEPTVAGAVGALDVGRLAAPDGAGAVGAPEQILLVVGGAENVISHQAEQEHSQGVKGGELHRVVDQVETLTTPNTVMVFAVHRFMFS